MIRPRSSNFASRRSVLALFVLAGVAYPALAQVQVVARKAEDTDQFGDKATDTAISVGATAIVVTSNHGVTMLNKSGSILAAHKFTDSGFPFKRFGTGTGSVAPSRWFDARSDYDAANGRQWMSYSEENFDSRTAFVDNISPLHLAVSRPMVYPNDMDSFGNDDWWYFTGNTNSQGNAGPAFDMSDEAMTPYPDGGPHLPFPPAGVAAGSVRTAVFDLPIIAIDEQAVYVTAFGKTADDINPDPMIIEYGPSYSFTGIYIFPIHFVEGGVAKSMLNGQRPPVDLIIRMRPRDLDEAQPDQEKDFNLRHYPVQEPEHFTELENAQLFISVDEDAPDVQQRVRLSGLWFDDTAPDPLDYRWRYTQRLDSTTGDLDDIDLGGSLSFRYNALGYDVETPDSAFSPATVGAFISSAVLTKDTQGAFRIFTAHHVYLDDGSGGVDGVAVQWYVIDPHLAEFRKVQNPATWAPSIVASGRITTNGTTAGDCYHPVIGVTPQGVAIIEYTFSNASTWPQVRRATLGNTYTSVASNTTVRLGPVNYSYSPSNDKWADYSDMQLDPSGCRLWSVHTLVHNPGGQPPSSITTTDDRDIWVFEVPGNCNNSNLNFDETTDLYDLALFNSFYATGARRVDMNTDGTTDSTDATLYQSAYDAATQP